MTSNDEKKKRQPVDNIHGGREREREREHIKNNNWFPKS